MNLRAYATLAQLRRRENVAAANITDNGRYLEKLRAATNSIENATHRVFQPEQATKRFDYLKSDMVFLKGEDLLSVSAMAHSITVSGDSTALNVASVVAFDQGYVELDPTVDSLGFVTVRRNAVSVTGVWGYHDDYSGSAWHGSGVLTNEALDTSEAEITTLTNTGYDAWYQAPALSEGQLIRIDSEWMQVIAINSATSIQVVRGANGTTAATHSTAAAIEVYEAIPEIQQLCVTWAALLVGRDESTLGKKYISDLGVEVPTGLPPEMVQSLLRLRKDRVA